LKLAYERAFSAIFDSNITTLLTCLILGWLGSEEIRGFAITLGLGVLFNLFTAVTVTRWIFQILLEKRIVNKPLRLMKIIGVPKIDWMAKRYWFWGFSLVTMVIGLVSFCVQLRGGNIWGIEFSSGTQSIVRLHDDAILTNPANGKPTLANDGVVGELFRNKAGQLGYDKLKDTARVEQVIDPNRQATFLRENFPDKEFPTVYPDGKFKRIAPDEWKKAKLNEQAFKMLDKNGDGALDAGELGNLPPNAYQIATVESKSQYVSDAARAAFGKEMVTRSRLDYKPFGGGAVPRMGVEVVSGGQARITPKMVQSADKEYQGDLMDYEGGVVFVIQDVNPPVAKTELLQRIREVRLQPDFANQMLNQTSVIELNPTAENTATSFAVMVKPGESLGRAEGGWADFADKEGALLATALLRQEALETTNFDPAIAGETATAAVFAVVLGWVVIIVYLWVRFGSFKWGAAAVVCLLHDLTIIIGMVAISGWLYKTPVGQLLGVEAFKIDLIMIAAFLTIIGYSVNDTIVVFDRIRENRGKLTTVSPAIINNAINQTLSRTILTSALTWITVFVMYVWGGSGIHSFNYAMLIGILFGTYSSIAVAAPLLLGFKEVVSYHHTAAVEAAK
jgi:SecD/SecF fusion protein